jgi:hypothetical protein
MTLSPKVSNNTPVSKMAGSKEQKPQMYLPQRDEGFEEEVKVKREWGAGC